nr:MAG TPA: hypothetical protein [Caudoviricetes sp.]
MYMYSYYSLSKNCFYIYLPITDSKKHLID